MAFNVNSSFAGLGTYTVTAPTAGPYKLVVKTTIPAIPDGDATASQLVITVNQNGTPIYTGAAGSRGATVSTINCAASDVITVVFTSSQAEDNNLNAIKSVISFG